MWTALNVLVHYKHETWHNTKTWLMDRCAGIVNKIKLNRVTFTKHAYIWNMDMIIELTGKEVYD